MIIEQMSTTEFDVLVIGGGITGAGIALDAASRGLKVALIDMQDFAGGTSGRSTKLIHGGLRYLKQFDFKLVAEVGKEREIIHRIAPHLTHPEPMLLPIVKGGSLGKFSTRIAMWIYEWMAGVKKEEGHKLLNREETENAEPLLEKKNLLGGILFYEYRTDDARLTIEVLKEAAIRGVSALNYTKAISFCYENNKITGAIVQDQITEQEYTLKSKYIVNASGPWVDELDDLEIYKSPHKLQITKGVHIVVDHKNLPIKQAVYFDALDKRMIFVIPREGKTYIGTTDTFYTGELKNPQITVEDKEYLLRCVNTHFMGKPLAPEDIESGWAGLRPLIRKRGKGPSEISRKDELFESESGMIIIAGGKLTGYRRMAERVVNLIAKKINTQPNKKIGSCITDKISLSGKEFSSDYDFQKFNNDFLSNGSEHGLSQKESELLVYRYGYHALKILAIIENLNKIEQNELPVLLRAQIHYCIEHEMCMNADDFFTRRTGMSYFDVESANQNKQMVKEYILNLIHQ